MNRARRTPAPEPAAGEPRGPRLWLFRVAAATLVPSLFLVTVEVVLHLAGFGYPSAFLMPVEGREGVRTTNPKFGWRFFPRRMARTPVPLEITEIAEEKRRIFILGGSAARGTPDSAYSFGRMLAALLGQGSDRRFVVHNAAMTAINSHVVREIAEDCAPHAGDLLVVYLGNNEVVGPYGAGTVFGSFSSSLAAIRATIRLRATRFGQLLDASLGGAGRDARDAEWRGMELFLEQRIAADDPRLGKVYDHFRRNLVAIVRRADRAGAETLLLTVATNLRDQPPFASIHRPDLSADERRRWQALYDTGSEAAARGASAEALTAWQAAVAIDDRYAELHFRIGQALLALGRVDEARRHLRRARDLDTLRFRADSRINDTIRRVAIDEAGRGVTLLDTAARFAAGGSGGPPLPGRRFFHEHVHLNFDGNLALAGAVYEHLLSHPAQTSDGPSPSPDPDSASVSPRPAAPQAMTSRETVADRLAYTPFDHIALEREILRLVSRPPFTGQLGHAEALQRRWQELGRLESELEAQAWPTADRLYRRRLEQDPDDLEIRRRYASLLQARQLPERASEQWRWLLERLPHVGAWRAALATALADAGRGEEALAELDYLRRSDGESAEVHVARGTVLESLGRDSDAATQYAHALRLHPHHSIASFNLATAALRRGDLDRAVSLYRELLEHHPEMARAHHNLGRCLEQQGRSAAAMAAYRQAIAADPTLAPAHNSLGLALEGRGDLDGAAAAYRSALLYEPGYALAHFNLADLQLSRGHAADAESHYRRGLALRPGNVQARYNRAAALRSLGRDEAAVQELEQVLAQRPDDPGTLHNLAWILATAQEPQLRQPGRAIELAQRASQATGGRSPEILETLAQAYAAAGATPEAIVALENALRLARATGRGELSRRLQAQLTALRAPP